MAERNLVARFVKKSILLSFHTYRLSLHLHDVKHEEEAGCSLLL